jgi:nucleotide-binding universal stress UspA family protein
VVDRLVFRSLLVPVDLSPISDRVVGRVALLPLSADARIILLHVVSSKLPPHARRIAERDAKRALDYEVDALARTLPETVAIRHLVREGAPAAEIIECASSVHAELIVMGRGGGRALRDVFLGSTAERVARQATRPVLVVRLRPRTPYRRPAVALDLDPVAHQVLALLPRVLPPPRPRVTIIHAYDVPYHGMIYPSLEQDELDECLDHYRDRAARELAKIVASAKVTPGEPLSWTPRMQHGAARSIIKKAVQKSDVDLLMLGTRAHSGIARAFLGTVAGDVLRSVTCDVLLVPPRPSR